MVVIGKHTSVGYGRTGPRRARAGYPSSAVIRMTCRSAQDCIFAEYQQVTAHLRARQLWVTR
jgi:hypothetical protein